MTNTKRILILASVFLSVAVFAAPAAQATITINATDVTGSAALNIAPAVASAITIGAAAQTGAVSLGASTAALTLNLGTGATGVKTIHIGDGATANEIVIGSATGSSSLKVYVGTSNFVLDGAATSTYAIGASTTSGTITIGGTSQTGIITLGSSNGTNIVAIGAGEGATTVNIAGGATAAKAVNIAIGNVANVVKIGSTNTTAGVGVKINGVFARNLPTAAVSFTTSTVATSSQLFNAGIFLHASTDSDARNLTLDTTANIAAAMPGGSATTGDTFSFMVANAGGTLTLVAGDASTTITTGLTIIPTSTTRIVYCQFTTATLVAICY